MLRDKKNVFPIIKKKIQEKLSQSAEVRAYGSRIRSKGRKNDFDVLVSLDKVSIDAAMERHAPEMMFNPTSPVHFGFSSIVMYTDAMRRYWIESRFKEIQEEMKDMRDEFDNPVIIDASLSYFPLNQGVIL